MLFRMVYELIVVTVSNLCELLMFAERVWIHGCAILVSLVLVSFFCFLTFLLVGYTEAEVVWNSYSELEVAAESKGGPRNV